MLHFLKETPDVDLANLAYTTTARRTHHTLRAAFCGDSIQKIIEALEKDVSADISQSTSPQQKSPVIFVFSGQGGSYAGMGKDLFRSSAQFRAILTDLDRMCDSLGFPPFTHLIAESDTALKHINVVPLHLSQIALQIALVDLWKIWGVKPDVVMGHSIGEYAALYAAGVLSAFDTLYLVGNRAQLIESRCIAGAYAMLSISGTADQVTSILAEGYLKGCEVACFNSPGMIVLSGKQQEIAVLEVLLKEVGFKCQTLDIPYGMHSHQMDAISSEFSNLLYGVRFAEPKIKFISTCLGDVVTEASSFGPKYFIKQTRESVKFQQAIMTCILQRFVDRPPIWLEIGSNASCLGLVRSNLDFESFTGLASLRKGENNWKTVSTTLTALYNSKKSILWREYHKDFTNSLSQLDLPHYAFDNRDFWITYKGNNQPVEVNGVPTEQFTESPPISACLHQCLERLEDEHKLSASFSSTLTKPHVMDIINGHKLSGVAICSSGIFMDIALSAAQYLLTDGDATRKSPPLSIHDLQMIHPVVPILGALKLLHTNVTRPNIPGNEFFISFSEDSASLTSVVAKCVVRIREQTLFDTKSIDLSYSIQQKVATLKATSKSNLADRIGSKVFYKLFSNLMEYGETYKGTLGATISEDFMEIITDVCFPVHEEMKSGRLILSPYWSDILGQSVGFLLNGNPDEKSDMVFIAQEIKDVEFNARDFAPDVRYQVYGCVDHAQGSDYQGHAYILHNGIVMGFAEGLQFKRMPRKTLHHILGKTVTPVVTNGARIQSSNPSMKENGHSIGPAMNGTINTSPKTNKAVSLTTSFLDILLEETGLAESELEPSTYFSDIGVDSMVSISVLAGLKSATGIELGASFLVEHSTLEDARRALRKIENQNTAPAVVDNWDTTTKTMPESNVVLMSARTNIPPKATLFLIADGAGSAAAYIHLPKLPDNVQVFTLESPWVHDPESFTCTFNEAAAIYLSTIRKKQPHGPYLLGGWSGGGIFAYEVSRLLLIDGEKVHGLIIIDMLAPQYVDRTKITMPTFELIENLGMLAGIDRALSDASPQAVNLKKHMFSTARCFSKMDPTPMEPGNSPDMTFVVWATDPISPKVSEGETLDLSEYNLDAWFYPSRHDFGFNGWNELVGSMVECFKVQGDHFSIMNPPQVCCYHLSHTNKRH